MQKLHLLAGILVLATACSAEGVDSSGGRDPGSAPTAVLALGARGDAVKAAHAYFSQYGYFESATLRAQYPNWKPIVGAAPADDSIFGVELQRAVSMFQARSGLPATGAIDEATRAAMDARFCGVPDSFEGADGADKWDPHEIFGFQSKRALTYSISIDASDKTGGLNVASIAQSAFNAWRLKSNLTFTKVDSNADIKISFVDRSDTILGIGTHTAIFMTNRADWGTGNLNMLTVFLHEIGHTLGFDHSSSVNGSSVPLMFPTVDSGGPSVTGLTQDELQALAVSPYTTWKTATGTASEAADVGSSTFGGAEYTWKVGNGTNSEGFKAWRWKTEDEDIAGNGGSWLQINGAGGSRLDLAGRVPWILVSAGANAGMLKSMRGAETSRNGTGWDNRGNCGFVDVGANASGTVWALGGKASNGDYQVYHFVGGSSTGTTCSSSLWRVVDGAASYIDVAPDGSPWVVTKAGDIYHRNGVTGNGSDGTSWSHYGGLAKDISIGPDPWGGYGAVWITGHPSQTQSIFLLNIQPGVAPNCSPASTCTVEARNQWYTTQNGGLGSFISVGKDALPWVVASNGSAHRRRPF